MNLETRKAGKNLRNAEITQQIIAAAVRGHRELGPGFLESIYEETLAVEFALSGIQSIRQHSIPLFYRDHQIGERHLDFLVEGKIIVELKAITELEDIHFAIGRSYLKATNLDDGLLLNFATIPLTIKRFCRERPPTISHQISSLNFFPQFLLS
jgi:GxxExxY protein